jgi:large repetitive protein
MHRPIAALLLTLLALPTLAAINGTVMTADGAPVAGAKVTVLAIEAPEARRMRLLSASPQPVPLLTTQTDARGNWSLESPKDPVVDLRINAAGFDPLQRRIERDEEVGAVALVKSETRSGTIKAGGKPVAGATVVLTYGNAEYVAKTDEQGKYDAPDPKRARSITVIHPAYAIDEESFFSAPSASALARTLSAGTTLTGRVLGGDGTTPAAKATVLVDNWPLGISGDDGSFTMQHVPSKWQQVVAQSGSLSAMRVQSNEKAVTLRLTKAAAFTGRMTDAKTKLPVAGATISLIQRTGGRMAMAGAAAAAGALTDAKGNFSVSVAPGSYMVSANHPGYELRQPLEVSIASGQQQSRELAVAPLARVSGMVVDEDRKPVAAATLTPEEASSDGFMMSPMRFMRDSVIVSGPDGRFSTRVSGDADMRMKATRRGLPQAKSETFRIAAGDRKSGVVITIPSGIAVSGRVTDREGKPLSGVAVTATEAASGPRGMVIRNVVMLGGLGQEEDAVRTGSDGSFTLRVKEGTYDFSFKREGYSVKTLRGQAVSPASNTPLEATLEPAVEITGRVVRGGTGVDGVMINTFSEGGSSASAVTGPDGSFTLSGLSPGEVRASMRKESDFIQEMRTFTAPARDITIELPPGTRVSGRVVDKSTRKPLTSFQAGVSNSRGGGGMMMVAPPSLKAFTTDDGTFVLDNVPSGAVNLVASAPGYAQARMNLTVEEGKPVTDLELELDPGTKLVGKVTGPDGSALSGVTVRIAQTGSGSIVLGGMGKQGVTDSNGEYTIDALEPSDENVEFAHPKYVGTRKTITPKGREVRLDVQLTSGQRLSGTVVTEAGAPVADAEVEAMAGAGTYRTTRSDANGTFTFDSLPSARYRFSASKRGFSETTLEDVDISANPPLRLVLKSGATLYGQVRGLTAEELQHTTIEARGESFANAAVDSSGNFRMEGAPTGTVRVSAVVSRNFSNRKSSQPQTVTVAAGESRQIDLEFSSDTVISGRVLRNGRPLASANVSFSPRRGSSTQTSSAATTDEQGRYSVSGLESGEYNVSVIDTQRFSPYQTTYEVRGSSTFDIDYTASALRGRVVDASGDPINDARVQLRATTSETPFRGDRVAATDVNGTFTIDFVAPGTYTVTAEKTGLGNEVKEVIVGERAPADVEFRLSKNDGVVLKVVDARDGRQLNAMVYVYDGMGRVVGESPMRFGGADSAADVELSLAPGAYTATVTSMGYAAVTVNLTSPGTQTVALSPGGRIVLRSSRSERQRVRLVDGAGRMYPRTPNSNAGRELAANPATLTYNNVAPGSYTIQVLTNNDTTVVKSVPVVVTEGGIAQVDV